LKETVAYVAIKAEEPLRVILVGFAEIHSAVVAISQISNAQDNLSWLSHPCF
jgi:hypothetical protein